MIKSGLADSPFFTQAPQPTLTDLPPEEPKSTGKRTSSAKTHQKKLEMGKQSRNNAVMLASKHESNPAWLDATVIQLIRRALKGLGKEATTYRFTPEEKKALMEMTYSYKVSGFKTSENELARIAINFLIEDHKANGHNSILERVLNALKE